MRSRPPIAFVMLVMHLIVLGTAAAFWTSAVLPSLGAAAPMELARVLGNGLLAAHTLLAACLWLLFVFSHGPARPPPRSLARRQDRTLRLELTTAEPVQQPDEGRLSARIEEVLARQSTAALEVHRLAAVLRGLRAEAAADIRSAPPIHPLDMALQHQPPAPVHARFCDAARFATSECRGSPPGSPDHQGVTATRGSDLVPMAMAEVWETERVVFRSKGRVTSRARVWLRKIGNRLRPSRGPGL